MAIKMGTDPVQVITTARQRIARVSAIRAAAYFIAPALMAIVLAAALPAIGALTWERMGYLLAPETMAATRIALIVVAGITVLAGAIRGWRAFSIADNFIGAAIQIDERVHAHQQVVTVATMSDPAAPKAARERSPLFPVLWRNVTAVLVSFNPETQFAVGLGEPLRRSSLPAAGIAVALALAMLAMVRPPTPLQKTARELRRLAAKIEASETSSPEAKKLAEQIRKVAADIQNPKQPPEEKKQEIAELMAAVEKQEASAGDTAGNSTGGKGSGAGTSSASAAGGSEGKGAGGQSNGQSSGHSKGKGSGKGEGQDGTASGQNKSGKTNGEKSGGADTIELKNEIAKAQAQVQTEDQTAAQSPSQPSPEQKTAQAPQPGKNPNLAGGSDKNGNQKGSAPMPVPQPGNLAQSKIPQGEGKKPNSGGTGGDTQLGEFPSAGNYQRFLKPGEKGLALDLKDARYVVFKIPSIATSEGDGKTVIDTERQKAVTAYTNAPLAPSPDTAPPDERQLVPPRYRELIR